MRKKIETLTLEEVKKLLKKHSVEKVSLNLNPMGGYNIPFGIYKINKGTETPMIYFSKPKGMDNKEYEDYLSIFKYLFYNDL